MENEKIKELISSWRMKLEGLERSLITVDRLEEAGTYPDPETSRYIVNARINQLAADIDDLEQLLP